MCSVSLYAWVCMHGCVCVRACVRACERACVRVGVFYLTKARMLKSIICRLFSRRVL